MRIVYTHLFPVLVKFPSGSELFKCVNKFKQLSSEGTKPGLPYAVGAVDGTHQAINRPSKDQESYFNRKGYVTWQYFLYMCQRMYVL